MSDFKQNINKAFNEFNRLIKEAIEIEALRLCNSGLAEDEVKALIIIKTKEATGMGRRLYEA